MLLVGLTGGIASGKSTVAGMLADRGAMIIDADEIARDVVEPGTPAWSKIVEHFGSDALLPDKRIDREWLAGVVFSDPAKLALLNEITHPEVMRIIAARLEVLRETDAVVVADIPLLAEAGAAGIFDLVVVVTATEDDQVSRLGRTRGLGSEQALARMRSQASKQDRAAVADFVIENTGTMEDLSRAVEDLWGSLLDRRKRR